MRKTIYILCVLFVGSAFLSSCNKKLQEDLEALEKQVADLKDQQNQTRSILGSNEPITAKTEFVDNNGDIRTINSKLYFKSNDYSTQYIEELSDGSYYIYIERFGDVEGGDNGEGGSNGERAYIGFNYNSSTKAITNKDILHEWSENNSYSDYANYYENWDPAPTINVTINSINVATGDISINVTASGDGEFTSNWGGPNYGESVSTTLSFSGKLRVFEYDPTESPVRKRAKN